MNVEELLRSFPPSAHFIYKPNPGNAGDAVIAAGTLKLFDKLGVRYSFFDEAGSTDGGDHILVWGGGGNLTSNYSDAEDFLRLNRNHKSIVIFPHTIAAHGKLLESLDKQAIVFAREAMSFSYLNSLDLNCGYYMDRDMALLLDKEDYPFKLTFRVFKVLMKIYFKKILSLRGDFFVLDAFRGDIESTGVDIPFDNVDISQELRRSGGFKSTKKITRVTSDFFSLIRCFKKVNTNRLHVGITGGILGKKVALYPNAYWKNQAVYHEHLKSLYPAMHFFEER